MNIGSGTTPGNPNEPQDGRARNAVSTTDLPGMAGLNEAGGEETFKLPFDPWRVIRAVRGRWQRLFWGSLTIGVLAFIALPKPVTYQAGAVLVRRESPVNLPTDRPGTAFRPQVLNTATLAGYLRSPNLMRRVKAQLDPAHMPSDLGSALEIKNEDNPDVIAFVVKGKVSAAATAELANLFLAEAVRATQELQARDSRGIAAYLSNVLQTVDEELRQANVDLTSFMEREQIFDVEKETDSDLQQRSQVDLNYQNIRIELETLDLKVKLLSEEILNQKRGEIDTLLIRFTEDYPLVQEQRAQLAALEVQLAQQTNQVAQPEGSSPVTSGLFQQIIALRVQRVALQKQMQELGLLRERIQQKLAGLTGKGREYSQLRYRLESIRLTQSSLINRLREARLFESNPPGYFQPLAVLTPADVVPKSAATAAALLALILMALCLTASLGLVILKEILDDRVKTAADVTRVTELPLLATLGTLTPDQPAELEKWALQTWPLLVREASAQGNPLVWGFVSSRKGEGCSTWIDALANAAAGRGLQVMKVSAKTNAGSAPSGSTNEGGLHWLRGADRISANVDRNPLSLMPPAGWSWGRSQLEQWKAAVAEWACLSNTAVLVELPPASDPSGWPLAETLPQVIWLAGSGLALGRESRSQVTTLRRIGCRLVGAALNREPAPFKPPTLPRWLAVLSVAATLSALGAPQDVEDPAFQPSETVTAVATNAFFSVLNPEQRAPWQERLTLGPGDALSLVLFGYPGIAGAETTIDPDGRISYLQAQGIVAAGLTIDELRARLEKELARYYRNPNVIVSPLAFRSKKYFILGAVVDRGVFILDRPISILEAVARAQGLASASTDGRSMIEVSDLSNSALIRQGQRMDVDFERLFHQGDLTQNIPLEPNDYLYFAPSVVNEIYYLGSVRLPGLGTFTPGMTLIQAITSRGGFGPGAHRKKVLVVRGSLRRPEPYVVDAAAILAGKSPDFRLQPKDIIYVSRNPWSMVGQVLDMVISTYLYAVTVTWTSQHMETLFDDPYIPGP